MKNKLAVSLMLISAIPGLTFAQGKIEDRGQSGIHEPGTGIVKPEIKQENKAEQTALGIQKEMNATSTDRRSRVSVTVREMLKVADRQSGIGQQVREMVQNHEEENNSIEDKLKEIKNRGQFRKFLFGPDYKRLSEVNALLARHTERIEELKKLLSQVTNEADKTLLLQRITEMENIKIELGKDAGVTDNGFSLFGWLNKIINGK